MNGKIVFKHDKSKNTKEDGIKLIQEVLKKHYFQRCNDSGAKEIIDKVISGKG